MSACLCMSVSVHMHSTSAVLKFSFHYFIRACRYFVQKWHSWEKSQYFSVCRSVVSVTDMKRWPQTMDILLMKSTLEGVNVLNAEDLANISPLSELDMEEVYIFCHWTKVLLYWCPCSWLCTTLALVALFQCDPQLRRFSLYAIPPHPFMIKRLEQSLWIYKAPFQQTTSPPSKKRKTNGAGKWTKHDEPTIDNLNDKPLDESRKFMVHLQVYQTVAEKKPG